MHAERISSDRASITLSRAELVLLNNALNEAAELLTADEFPIRVGGSADQAHELQRQLKAVIQQMKVVD